MQRTLDRRDFGIAAALGVGTLALSGLRAQTPTTPKEGQKPKRVKIGVSTLAWNVSPTSTETFEQALKDISELGYSGFETVSPMIEALDASGALAKLMDKYHIAMKAGYL